MFVNKFEGFFAKLWKAQRSVITAEINLQWNKEGEHELDGHDEEDTVLAATDSAFHFILRFVKSFCGVFNYIYTFTLDMAIFHVFPVTLRVYTASFEKICL